MLSYFFAVFLIAAAPPAWIGLRIGAFLAILIFAHLVFDPTPFESGFDYDIAIVGSLMVSLVCFLGISLRLIVEFFRHGKIRDPDIWPNAPTAANRLVAFALGVPSGGVIALQLGDALTGLGPGLVIHLAVLAICGVIGLCAIGVLGGNLRGLALGVMTTVALVTVDAIRLPAMIEMQANALLPGLPRCLMLGPARRAPVPQEDLLGLTVEKPIKLLVQKDDHPRLFRWSFRAHRFVETMFWRDPPVCTPTSDQLIPH